MDSAGYLGTAKTNRYLREFVCQQSLGRKLIATPRLQTDQSSSCGKFALVYLYFRTRTGNNLCKFAQAFGYNLESNEELIQNFFRILTDGPR